MHTTISRFKHTWEQPTYVHSSMEKNHVNESQRLTVTSHSGRRSAYTNRIYSVIRESFRNLWSLATSDISDDHHKVSSLLHSLLQSI